MRQCKHEVKILMPDGCTITICFSVQFEELLLLWLSRSTTITAGKQFVIINFYRKSVIAGMTAGAFGQFIASPTDLVKVQMQMEGKRVLIEGRQPRYVAHSTC